MSSFTQRLFAWTLAMGCQVGLVRAQSTATFTADSTGTYPNTFRFEPGKRLLTVDLSGLPPEGVVPRAELVLTPITHHLQQRPMEPTRVFPVGQPDQALKFAAPRFMSLDARAVVQAALRAGKPLELQVQSTAQGVTRLEITWSKGKARAALPRITGLQVNHRAGQTMIAFDEPRLEGFPEFKTGAEVRAWAASFQKRHPGLSFRIYRSQERISASTLDRAQLVGECEFFTAWNRSHHQDETDRKPPLRYRVTDGGPEVPWGRGIYAHNPDAPGRAYYAVTVCWNGEEDLTDFDAGNATATPVEEAVGPGEPILQWKETPSEWMYRHAPPGSTLTRLIYTRWEAWPRSPRPSVPVDYLVVLGNDPRPEHAPREAESLAVRAVPAPVGLHLHCWGGSLHGGYGWWYNAHRGAVLFASNQQPYDWWTGHHEAIGTCKTWGDGHVRPFTMDRLFAFLDWAATQWTHAPANVRGDWRPLDLTRVFTAGNSMGGSGAPMYAIRHPGRIAWALGWVGVHVPEESPQFKGSYAGMYGPRHERITMPEGTTSPWDYFNDVWYLRQHAGAETGLILASNGRNDGAIGWGQAVKFARALQETRRPHVFNWGMNGHGTRTLTGANFDLDVRTDQSLPAFTRCTLDQDIGSGDPAAGDPTGAYNAFLRWRTDNLVDTSVRWELTVELVEGAPQNECRVDLTPRRLQQFRTPAGRRFRYTVTDVKRSRVQADSEAVADADSLLTLPQVPLVKGENRVTIVAAK